MKSETCSDRAVGPVSLSLTITHNLRRGVSYRMGRDLTDAEALRVLESDVRALVSRLADLGAWVDKLDRPIDPAWTQVAVPRPAQPASVPPASSWDPPPPPAEPWQRRFVAAHHRWGRKMSPATRAKMSAAQLRRWAAQKALACEK